MKSRWNRPTAIVLLLVVGACQSPTYRVHRSLYEDPGRELPEQVLVVPARVEMFTIHAGGVVEPAAEWSRDASDKVDGVLREHVYENEFFEVIDMVALTPEEQELFDEHVALFLAVSETARSVTSAQMLKSSADAWGHKLPEFDYSIGPGLRFLKQRTGADACLITAGNCQVGTGGRQAMSFLFGVNTGHATLAIGLVDLETGNLLWTNNEFTVSSFLNLKSFVEIEDVEKTLGKLTADYPGLEEFEKLRARY